MRLINALSALMLLVGVPAPAAAQGAVAGSVTFRDVSFQLAGEGWQRIETPATPGIAPTATSFTIEQAGHKYVLAVYEIQAASDAQVLRRDDLIASIFDSIRKTDTADVAQVRGAHRQERPETTRIVAGAAYPVSRSRITVDGSPTATDGLYLLYFPLDFADRRRLVEFAWIDTHLASADASDLSGFDSIVSSLSFRPLRDVLLADDFSNAQTGVLPNSPPNPPAFQRGYMDGEYMVRVDFSEVVANAPTRDEYADATLAVDAHPTDETPQAQIWLYCRRFGSVPSGYRFRVEPATQRFSVDRVDKAQPTTLVSMRTADVINSGSDVNHLELTCAGSTIAGSINGQPVFSVQDATYTQGTLNIGASGPSDGSGEVRFANFALLQA
jgi:hypothetical protein